MNIRLLKDRIKELTEDLKELEQDSHAYKYIHNEIIKLHHGIDQPLMNHNFLSTIVVAYINAGLSFNDVKEILDSLESAGDIYYSDTHLENIFSAHQQE